MHAQLITYQLKDIFQAFLYTSAFRGLAGSEIQLNNLMAGTNVNKKANVQLSTSAPITPNRW